MYGEELPFTGATLLALGSTAGVPNVVLVALALIVVGVAAVRFASRRKRRP